MLADLDRTAFVTGGSGFVGGALVARLVRDGWTVRALARSPASEAKVEALGARPVHGDLEDRAALNAGAHGCAHVFHAAAHVDGSDGDPEPFERLNVRGTALALAAARDAGVRRFVHVGTEAALLRGQALVAADERTPLQLSSPVNYARTKARAEAAVIAASEEGVFETVSIRPRFVWGVGDTTLLPGIADQVRAGKFAWIGGGRHRTSTTHVDNTVEGLVLGALRGHPGNAYFVLDDRDVVWREFIGELLRTQDVEPPTRNIPAALGPLLRRAGKVDTFALWLSTRECTLDDTRARDELGYVPVVSRDEGLASLRAATLGTR